MLEIFKKDLKTLPYLVSWLKDGPERTRAAVLMAKRRVILMQAPLVFFVLGGLALVQMLGLIERRGPEQFIAHWLATLIFVWPPTFLPISKAAKMDALSHAEVRQKLHALSLGLRIFAGLAMLVLFCAMAIFACVKFGA